jgi:hypothetical protein
MRARLLLRERWIIAEDQFADVVIWELPNPVSGSRHAFKHRLALVVDEVCVLRFDNEAGKGDHKHLGDRQVRYEFSSVDQLLNDFWNEIGKWRRS